MAKKDPARARSFHSVWFFPCLVLFAGDVVLADQGPSSGENRVPMSHEQVIDYLAEMRATQRRMMNIDPAEGAYLAALIEALNAKRVLEIGTSNGYSAIWLALGLRVTGGQLITLEIDEGRHALAEDNFRSTGMDQIIDLRLTDALEEIPRLSGPFDLVFIDAWKDDYPRYLEMVLPKVRSGGVIAAHNMNMRQEGIRKYREIIDSDPRLRTEYIDEGPAGMSVSYKQ